VKQIKFFEVRDFATTIPMCAVRVERFKTPAWPLRTEMVREDQLLARAGWGQESSAVYMFHLGENPGKVTWDCYTWGDRTRKAVHAHICREWDNLQDGQLLDVRVILGETTEPCETDLP